MPAVDYILDLMTAGHQQSIISIYKNSKLNESLKLEEAVGEMEETKSKDMIHSPTHYTMTTNTTFISKPHFEIVDNGGGMIKLYQMKRAL